MSIINKTEEQKRNDLFFLCSLIEYIGRQTHNERSTIVQALGEEGLARLYNLADVLHAENIDQVSADVQERYGIAHSEYDNLVGVIDAIPTHWEIGKVYSRLILSLSSADGESVIRETERVFSSWLPRKVDNYNSSMYCESPSYLLESFRANKVL